MKIFNRIKLRIQDMQTINKLIPGANDAAQLMGEKDAGAEHFLLSALNLPDGSAKRVFERLGTNAEKFKKAVNQQYKNALTSVGIDVDILDGSPSPIENKTFNTSKPSGVAVMKDLYQLKSKDKDRLLLGAHVIGVVARKKHGVTARAFKEMGLKRDEILLAVEQELRVGS